MDLAARRSPGAFPRTVSVSKVSEGRRQMAKWTEEKWEATNASSSFRKLDLDGNEEKQN